MSPSLLSGAARLAGTSLLRLQSDERLAELAQAGHDPAFGALVDRYRADLLRYCERLVGQSRAEDVLQQALLNAHLAMSSLSENSNVRAWLYRIAHNVAVNVLRSAPAVGALDDRAAAPDAIHEDLEVRERLRAALEAISRLPQPQRDALTLRAIEGRSHDEIADALGVTPGAARQQIHRARATVRAAVSAITPYGLLVRFAMAGGGTPLSGPELAAGAGAGAGATVAKVTAGLLAVGAVAGGATHLPNASVLHHHRHQAAPAAASASATGQIAAATPATDSAGPAVDRLDSHGRNDAGGHGRGGRSGSAGHGERHGRSPVSGSPFSEDRRGSDDVSEHFGSGETQHSGSDGGGSSSDDHSGSGDSGTSGSSGSGSSGSGDDHSGSGDSGSGSGDSGSGSSGSGDSSGSGSGSGDGSVSTLDLSGSGSGDSGSGSGSNISGSGDSGTSGGGSDSGSSGSGRSGGSDDPLSTVTTSTSGSGGGGGSSSDG